MKLFLAVFSALFALTISAQSVMTYDFTKAEEGKSWILDGDRSFRPAPQFTFKSAEKAWCAEKAQGKNGFLYKNRVRSIAVKDGDVLTVTCEVKGKGSFVMTSEYLKNKNFAAMYPGHRVLPLKDSWSRHTVQFHVKDAKKRGITHLALYFGGRRGTTLWIRNISVKKGK